MPLVAVAQRGSRDFLICNVDSAGGVESDSRGYIVRGDRVLASFVPVLSSLARGYWGRVSDKASAALAVQLVRDSGFGKRHEAKETRAPLPSNEEDTGGPGEGSPAGD